MFLSLRPLLAIILVSFAVANAAARSVVFPLGELGGSWLGSSEDNGEYFRLEIDNKGRGVLTVQYLPDDAPDAYEVLSTSLSGYAISFKLRSIGEAEDIFVRGSADKAGLRLEVGGTNNGWSRKVFLENESDVLSRINAVTRRAREFKASQATIR
jgi:hypothetical protein